MSQFVMVQDFVDQLRKTRTLPDLSNLLESVTSELGYDFFALVQHVDVRKSDNRESVWIGNYPMAWIEVFEERGLYATDPIHVASQRTNRGFAWSELGEFIRLNAHHKRVLDAASREGIGDGFTVPAHLPGDSNGTCSFAMKVGRTIPHESFMAAQLVGMYAMECGRQIVRRKQQEESDTPRLTQRQLDCLVHVSHGKSDWEIAQILGIKESTVRDYIEDACARYDVHRRVQLVVRALHDGHLTLRDAIG